MWFDTSWGYQSFNRWVGCGIICNPAQGKEPDQIMGANKDLTTNRDSNSGKVSYRRLSYELKYPTRNKVTKKSFPLKKLLTLICTYR